MTITLYILFTVRTQQNKTILVTKKLTGNCDVMHATCLTWGVRQSFSAQKVDAEILVP